MKKNDGIHPILHPGIDGGWSCPKCHNPISFQGEKIEGIYVWTCPKCGYEYRNESGEPFWNEDAAIGDLKDYQLNAEPPIGSWVKQWEVESSDGKRYYTISLSDQGVWGCSCPAWTRHMPRVDCKHIARIKEQNPDWVEEGLEYKRQYDRQHQSMSASKLRDFLTGKTD